MGDTTKEQLGDYELLQLIGDGAQGKVFKARRAGASDGFYALKVLRFSGEDAAKVNRFNQSAATLQKLDHPAIVRYHGSYTWHAGEWDEAHCLVMEYLDGESLHDVIKKHPRGLPWLEVRRIFEACLEGLIYAREQGLIHRDLKPSNIFITRDGAVKLIDFDIARREDGSQSSTAGWKGTFDYMAPDFVQVTNFRGDEQSDIFSLGVCLFQAMTGRLPFPPLGEGAHIGYLTRWREPAGVTPVLEGGLFRVLVNVKALITRSVDPSRESRFASFADMLAALRGVEFRRLEHKGGDTYEMTDWLGRGGFGDVYLGRRVSDGLAVAIKRLHSSQYSDRFIREARIVQKYPHDALVKYVDFIETDAAGGERQCFLIMEYLDGMPRFSLRNRLIEFGPPPVRETVELFIRFFAALQFLHENARPIIHRDIKPGNLYAPPGRPEAARIFDLGIARDVAGTATSGGIPGTLDYMAPEFATAGADRGTAQTDVFAMCLCLYEAITGEVALERLPTDMGQAWLKFQQRSTQPLPIRFSGEVFHRWPTLGEIVKLGLSEQPEHRPSAGEIRQMLESLLPALPHDERSDRERASTCTADFQRGEDVSAGLVATPAPNSAPAAPLTAKTVGLAAGSPEAAAAEAFVEARKAERGRSWLLVAGAAAMALAAAAWFLSQRSRHQEAGTGNTVETPAPPATAVVTRVEPVVPPVVEPPPFQLDARFSQADASSAYARELTLEIARIEKAVADGTLRAPAVRAALDSLRLQATSLPRLFRTAFDLALAGRDYARAATVLADWQAAAPQAEAMGLTAARMDAESAEMKAALASRQLDEELTTLRASLPANPNAAGAWAEAETAAGHLDRIASKSWDGVPVGERDARIASVAAALQALVEARLSLAATPSDLEALRQAAPQLVKRYASSIDARAASVMQAEQGRDTFRKTLDALLNAVPAEVTSAADLVRAESVAAQMGSLAARAFQGVSEAEKQVAVSHVKEALLPALGATVANLRSAALEKTRTAAKLEDARADLADLEKRYPNITALVAASHRKALADVDAAWKARPPVVAPPPVTPPVMPPAATASVVRPVTPPAATAAPPAVVRDTNEDELIRVLLAGGQAFVPQGKTSLDVAKANDLLAAAGPIRQGFTATDLMMSPKPGQDYLAAVGEFWKKTAPFGARVQDAAWQLIHDQLVRISDGTIKGMIAARPPAQQARIRREFLKVLALADEITGRVSACTPQDVLRARVSLYFEEGFFNDALLTEKVGNDTLVETKISWIKEPFDKVRARRGISAGSR